MTLLLDEKERDALWRQLFETIENYVAQIDELEVARPIDADEIRTRLSAFDFEKPVDAIEALNFAADNLRRFQVHTPHPRYFGLFNPAPTTMGIAADALVAAFNPQLAAWSHNAFAAETERHLIKKFAARFGYDEAAADGTFCSGGAEANHTALLAALVSRFPTFSNKGLRALDGQPVFYVSSQSHHSFVKAARFCGLGTDAVRAIETDANFKMSAPHLAAQIEKDRAENFAPFAVVATAGTTNAGLVDDIEKIGEIAARENLWLHVDAAWGGAAAFVAELRAVLRGIERADSITFDAHKWLSVPMGAGIFLTRHSEILSETCRITTDYMPRDAADFGVADPFTHSLQWSRRFIGLKVFLSLAVAGWKGYEEAIQRQAAMGDLLRRKLEHNDWLIINQTPLPVVCFTDAAGENSSARLNKIAERIVASGTAWISTTRLAPDVSVLRACITNYRTRESDLEQLIISLNKARKEFSAA